MEVEARIWGHGRPGTRGSRTQDSWTPSGAATPRTDRQARPTEASRRNCPICIVVAREGESSLSGVLFVANVRQAVETFGKSIYMERNFHYVLNERDLGWGWGPHWASARQGELSRAVTDRHTVGRPQVFTQ